MTSDEYIKTIRVKDLDVNLGVDDYGQSYFIESTTHVLEARGLANSQTLVD